MHAIDVCVQLMCMHLLLLRLGSVISWVRLSFGEDFWTYNGRICNIKMRRAAARPVCVVRRFSRVVCQASTATKTMKIGTRGSPLALAQAYMTRDLLKVAALLQMSLRTMQPSCIVPSCVFGARPQPARVLPSSTPKR